MVGPPVPTLKRFGSSAKLRFFGPVEGSNPIPRIILARFNGAATNTANSEGYTTFSISTAAIITTMTITVPTYAHGEIPPAVATVGFIG